MNIEEMKTEVAIQKYKTTNMELVIRVEERKVEIKRLEKQVKENNEKIEELKGGLDVG